MHLKRSKMPRTWPMPRKERRKRYIAVPSHSTTKGISLLFLLRDVLGVARTRKEVRVMMLNRDVKVNNVPRTNDAFPVHVFDVINLEKAKKNYRLEIVRKRFHLTEISDKDAERKVVRILGKTLLSGKLVQMNLRDGQNIVTKEKFSVGDSAIMNNKEGKLEKVLPLKEGAEVEIILGKHAGKKGEIIGFEKLFRGKTCRVKLDGKEVSLPVKTVLVIG